MLGTKNNPFAGSKDEIKLQELQEFVYQHGKKLSDKRDEITSHTKSTGDLIVSWFNKEFQETLESLEGEPIIGACYSCVNWFEKKHAKEYQIIIDNFNADMKNYTESMWKNEGKD